MEKPAIRGDGAQHQHDEQRRGGVEGGNEAAEIAQCSRPVFADREGHRAERANRRGFHDDGDDAEEGVAEIVDERAHRTPAVAEHHQREPEQDGDEQHLQDVALGEGADHGVGDDMEEELDRRLVRGARGVIGDRGRIAGSS